MGQAFRVLASPTRIRILHALCRDRELAVQDVSRRLAMKIAAVSNQLRRMAALGVVGSRTEGTRVFYFMVDPCVLDLLDRGACLARDAERRRR